MVSKTEIPEELLEAISGGVVMYRSSPAPIVRYMEREIHVETDEGPMCFELKDDIQENWRKMRRKTNEFALEDICKEPVPIKAFKE